jgi:predicted MFS family arabinose efflux permease
VFIFAVGIGPFPGGLLATHWGLAAPFLAYAATSLLASGVAWLAIPETRPARPAGEAEAAEIPFRAQLRLLTVHQGFLLVSLIAFVNAVARTGALFNIIPILARDRLALDPDRIGFGLALASVVGLALAYPAGVLVDRYGRKIIIVPATVLSESRSCSSSWRPPTRGSWSPARRGAWRWGSAAPRPRPTRRTPRPPA